MATSRQRLLDVLATRFLSGEATAADVARLQERLREPATATWFSALRERWQAAGHVSAKPFDAGSAWRRIAPQLADSSRTRAPHSRKR